MIFGWQKRSKRGRSLAAAGGFLLLLAALSVGLRPPAEEPQPALALALLGKTGSWHCQTDYTNRAVDFLYQNSLGVNINNPQTA